MNKKLRTILIGKPFKITAGLVIGLTAAYFLLGYFAVNPIAQRVLPWVAEHKLASRIAVERVEFDPLRFILTVDKLRLTRTDGGALASLDQLQVDLEANGLFKRAWHLRDIRLRGPGANLEIARDGKLNWAELIAKLNEDKEPDDNTIPRVIIDHVLIDGGNLRYAAHNRPVPFITELKPLALELDGFSTLPQDRGDYLLAARMPDQGATLRWKGTFGANPLISTGSVEIQQLHLAKLSQVLGRQALPLDIAGGDLGARLNYQFAMVDMAGAAEPKPQAKLSDIALNLAQLGGALNPHAQLTLAEAHATLPALDLALDKGGRVQLQGLDFSLSGLELKNDNASLLKLGRADINGIAFDMAANRLDIAEIALQQGEVHATRAKDGTLDWQQIAPAPQDAPAPASPAAETPPFRFGIASVKLQQWQAHYTDHTFVRPLRAGIQDINLGLAVRDEGEGVQIDTFDAELAALTLHSASAAQPVASLAKITLADGAVSLKDSSAKLSAIHLAGLQTQVTMDAQQKLNWQAVLESLPAPAAKTAAEPASPSPWKVALGTVTLENAGVRIEDRSNGTPVVLDMENASLELKDGSLDLAKALPLKAGFRLKQGGRFELAGKLAPAPLKGDLTMKLEGVPLKLFSPYLNRHALLKIADGQASLRGKLALKPGKSLSGQFSGGFNIANLAINEEADNRPFLSWQSVSSDTLRLSLAPDRLHMDELRVARPVGSVIIFEDKTLNVQRMLRPKAAGSAAQPAAPAKETDPFPVTVDRVSVTDGDIEFADLSLVPQFGTRMHTLGGVINGLSTDAASTAQVELDGKVDEYGSARIRGSIQPFKATDYTDLQLAFRNLEMNRLTPYSGKFAGRKIDSGKMSVDLEYKIKNRQLSGENKFVINTLKLGERVESPDAVDLPLDLAIALMEDSNGVIDLDLPISGSLDDPQFSYGKIIWKAIVNVIGKIATAPFRALGKLLGISADKLEAITFDPGESTLLPPEQEKLKAIADAMAKRPSLTLGVTPAFDAAADKAALQEQAIRRAVLKEMGLTLKPGEQPGPLDLNNVKVQSAVENLHKDLKGQARSLKAVAAVRDYFRKSKPEDIPRYETMVQELKTAATVSDSDLLALAKARAEGIRSYLVEQAGLTPERVHLKTPDKVSGGKAVPLKMELGVAKGSN